MANAAKEWAAAQQSQPTQPVVAGPVEGVAGGDSLHAKPAKGYGH